MSYHPTSLSVTLSVIAIGVACFAMFLALSSRKKRNSAYLTPGLIAACMISPIAALIIGVIQSIKCAVLAKHAAMDSVAAAFVDVKKPLIYSLVLAIFLCGCATIYLKTRMPEKLSPSSKRSRLPAFFSILVLAVGIIPFSYYHRALKIVSYVLTQDKHLSGRTPESVAHEIAGFLAVSLLTGILAGAIIIASLILCLFWSAKKEEVFRESHILFMHSGTLLILIWLVATQVYLF